MKKESYFWGVFLGAGLFLLLVRLFLLQIVLGGKNLAIAEGNRIRQIINPAPRGVIYDRHDRALVQNIPVYLLCPPGEKEEKNCRSLTREEALNLEANGAPEGEELRELVGRDYLFGSSLAHVLGCLDWELKGASGLEAFYDSHLSGQDGGEIFEVDTEGRKIREIKKIPAGPGKDLYLWLDAALTQAAFSAFEGKKGALVATEAQTGRVLALASSPSFDPNLFVRNRKRETNKVEELLSHPDLPFFNRAVDGVYPPGSTFKIVSAVAGLEEEKIDGETLFEDTGMIKIGEYSYANWYFTRTGKTEGKINVVRAIKRSTDTFFYQLGEKVGAESLAAWAKGFGLGRPTGIDLKGEAAGLVPTPDWKLKATGERWFLGNTYHFAIGQADLLATPLQINQMTGVIANEGRWCSPRLADLGQKPDCLDLKLRPETLSLVKEGLKEACLPGGTSGIFANLPYQVACKTGTAEFGPVKENGYRDTHAWFTAFAPVENPEIVVTALVEGGGEGSEVAAPIVKKVMEKWFED